MPKDKLFKLVAHSSQALVLEEEILLSQDKVYEEEFRIDFYSEQLFISTMQMVKSNPPGEDTNNDCIEQTVLKKIHRKLAMKIHPDKQGGNENEFKKIQEAYESKDISTLQCLGSSLVVCAKHTEHESVMHEHVE